VLAGRAALGCRLVSDDEAFAAFEEPHAADRTGARDLAIHSVSRKWGDFEEIGSFVEQRLDALAGEELSLGDVTFVVLRASAFGGALELRTQAM
jgi:hypothetical protein